MNKFHVIKMTHEDEAQGKSFQLMQIVVKIIMGHVDLLSRENGNVLIYSTVSNEDYLPTEYIKDSLYTYLTPYIQLETIDLIDEEAIPTNASIVFKL